MGSRFPQAITIGLVATFFITSVALAKSSYAPVFNNLYNTANTRLDDCAVCHPGGRTSRLDPYGQAFDAQHAAGKSVQDSLLAIESLDSDGDGWTNIQEIRALTFPGLPADHPTGSPTPTPTAPPTKTPPPTATPPSGTPVPTRTSLPTSTPTFTQPPTTTPTPGGDSLAPEILSFAVTPSFNLQAARISWDVRDAGGSHLRRLEIWRAADAAGQPDPATWHNPTGLAKTFPAAIDQDTGAVEHPMQPGVWWYRLHVVDHAGNWAFWGAPVKIVREGTAEPGYFSDVPRSYWANPYIEALQRQGYVAGCRLTPDVAYCPANTMTRSESSVYVLRGDKGAGYTPPAPAAPVFSDVPSDRWDYKWATALWNEGYTKGCSPSPLSFCPGQPLTLAEASVLFLRMSQGQDYQPPIPAKNPFVDLSSTAWYTKWMVAAFEAGLIGPCRSDAQGPQMCPDSSLTRAMAAYIMTRAKGIALLN